MSVKNLAEQIIDGQVVYLDLDWNRQRALLLFLLGMENGPISDFCPTEEIETEIGDLSPQSTKFPPFNTYFKTL